MAGAQQIETELSLNEFLMRRRILKVANRLLGQLRSQQIVKLLVNGGLRDERQIILILVNVMTRASES